MAITYIHNLVKIHLVTEGYLPNYPYHLISDIEMCDAFMDGSTGYFYDTYPCLVSSYTDAQKRTGEYDNLVRALRYHITQFKTSDNNRYQMPDWVYSYMLGKVVGPFSDKLDIHDVIHPLGVDNIDDEFTAEASIACYRESKDWLSKTIANTHLGNTGGLDSRFDEFEGQKIDLRPPTMFGEPHVIKSLRIKAASPILESY